MPKLKVLNLSGCSQLPEVNLDGFDNLTSLKLSYTKITKLPFKQFPKLK